jgi:Carboxypeptidase regulatory-like domain
MEGTMSSSLKRASGLLLTALLVLAWTAGAWAQAGTGEITGIILDPSGAVVAKAEITLANDATGDVRKTQSTAAGTYHFSALPIVGAYTLTVTTPGFGEY